MKRKIFSKLLMVALVIAAVGSFVSCKDYDDDINNLQKQIDAKAALSELTALQSTLDSKIAAAQAAAQKAAEDAAAKADASLKSTLEAAIADAKKAGTDAGTEAGNAITAANKAQKTAEDAAAAAEKADKDAKDALAKALEDIEAKYITKTAAEKAVADALATVAESYATKTEAEAIKNSLASLKSDLESDIETKIAAAIAELDNAAASVDAIWKAVTSVELIGSWTSASKFANASQKNLLFLHGKKVASVFGDETTVEISPDKVTYVAGDSIEFDNDVLVRVNPVNATFTADQVKLINSKGENLIDSGWVHVTNVEPFTELLTRAGNATGLWRVSFTRDEKATDEKFEEITKGNLGVGKVVYAVAINNTKDQADRVVASTFDLGIHYGAYVPAIDFVFNVDDISVATIHNRWDAGNKYVRGEDGTIGRTNPELEWTAEDTDDDGNLLGVDANGLAVPAAKALTGTDDDGKAVTNTRFATAADGENRYNMTTYPCLPVKLNKSFVISDVAGITKTAADNSYIQYYYAVLDIDNAIESNPSEKNIWESYTIKGLGQLKKTSETLEITITDKRALNDIIGFRVYAVNFDGTLADPDGKAFYVRVGNPEGTETKKIPETVATGENAVVLYAAATTDQTDAITINGAALYKDSLGVTADGAMWVADVENPDYYVNATATENTTVDATNPFTVTFYKGTTAVGTTAASIATATNFKISFNPAQLLDGATYTKKLAILQKNNAYATTAQYDTLKYVTFKVTKQLPTSLPAYAKVELADNIGENGVLTVYPSANPTKWGKALNYVANASKGEVIIDGVGVYDMYQTTVTLAPSYFKAKSADDMTKLNANKLKLYVAGVDTLTSAGTATKTAGLYSGTAWAPAWNAAGLPYYSINTTAGSGRNLAMDDYYTVLNGANQTLTIRMLKFVNGTTSYAIKGSFDFGPISRPSADGDTQTTKGKADANNYIVADATGTLVALDYHGVLKDGVPVAQAKALVNTGVSLKFANWADSFTFPNKLVSYKTPEYVDGNGITHAEQTYTPSISVTYGNPWQTFNKNVVAGGVLTPTPTDLTMDWIAAQSAGSFPFGASVTNLSQFLTDANAAAGYKTLQIKSIGMFKDAAGTKPSEYYAAGLYTTGGTAIAAPYTTAAALKTTDKIMLNYIGGAIELPSNGVTEYLVIKLADWYSNDYFRNTFSWTNWDYAAAERLHTGLNANKCSVSGPSEKVIAIPVSINN